MKLNTIKMSALAALAACTLTAPAMAGLSSYNADDLFLGFRKDGNTSADLLINLGSSATFRDATVPFTLTLNNLDSQLTTLFGATWKTDGTVTWGLIGTPGAGPVGIDSANLLYTSQPAGDATDTSLTPFPVSTSSQAGPSGVVLSMKNYYSLPQTTTGTVPNSAVGNPSNGNSWYTRVQTGFADGNITPVEDATNGFGLDLFRVPQGGASATITQEGRLTFGTGANDVTFTPLVAVPEPTTAIVGGLLMLSMGVVRNRKNKALTA